MALVKVGTLSGIPIHYDRFRPEDYGQPGHPHSVYMTAGMQQKMDALVTELKAESPAAFGAEKYILTAGAYVDKPGYHGQGRAFDLDGLIWERQAWIATSFPRDPQLYLAIESIVRRTFGTVLAYDYNVAHQDHIHMDDGRNATFEKLSKSNVIYLQNVLYYVYGIGVGLDGVWGPQTDGAQKMVREQLGIGGFGTIANWHQFLLVTARKAFEIVVQRDKA